MLGYVNNEKANREGYWDAEDSQGAKEKRWFRTGDEGYLTDEGYLVLTGRLKEVSCVIAAEVYCWPKADRSRP